MMGGDYAPRVTVDGLKLAYQSLPDEVEYVLFGDEEGLKKEFNTGSFDRISFVHAPLMIEMSDDPTKAFSSKRDSTIVKGFEYLAAGKIDGFCSAGNTGAMLVGAISAIGVIPGIIRPGITVSIPRENAGDVLLLDVGINPECRPEVLLQYGILGSLYTKHVKGIDNPSVGLLNIGSEDKKGNLLTKATFSLMKESGLFNFVGNIEGYDIFSDKCPDVIVCDGFVGNIILKHTEGLYALLKRRGLVDEYIEKFNFEHYGGTPILGINKNVIIGHGVSNDVAIKTMIENSYNVGKSEINKVFINAFKNEKV